MNEYVFELLRVNKEINGRITFQQSYKKDLEWYVQLYALNRA